MNLQATNVKSKRGAGASFEFEGKKGRPKRLEETRLESLSGIRKRC